MNFLRNLKKGLEFLSNFEYFFRFRDTFETLIYVCFCMRNLFRFYQTLFSSVMYLFFQCTGLKFIPEPFLSLDNDKWCRELETKAVYILSRRYSWDPVAVLNIFAWKKQNFNYNRRSGRKSRPVSVPSVLPTGIKFEVDSTFMFPIVETIACKSLLLTNEHVNRCKRECSLFYNWIYDIT
jgi:hypothetical protein